MLLCTSSKTVIAASGFTYIRKNLCKTRGCNYSFELLMMSGVSLETCWAIKKHWNNKFYYTVASCWLFLYDLYYRPFCYGCLYGRYDDAVSSWDYILSNGRIFTELKIGIRHNMLGNTMEFAGRHWEKPRQTSVRITGRPDHRAVVLQTYQQFLVGTPGISSLGIWKNERN